MRSGLPDVIQKKWISEKIHVLGLLLTKSNLIDRNQYQMILEIAIDLNDMKRNHFLITVMIMKRRSFKIMSIGKDYN